jgi:hypothetical protein
LLNYYRKPVDIKRDSRFSEITGNHMKRHAAGVFFLLCFVFLSGVFGCQKSTDLSDQNPMLVVNVNIVNQTIEPIDNAHQIYLIYYNSSNWTEPWLIQSTTDTQFFNPVVLSYTSMYLAVFYDKNGSGTLNTGDPYNGYSNITFPNPLTQIQFFPLEIKHLDITLDFTSAF